MYQIDFQKPEHVHFIGIGGISMSGLAEILMEEGFAVSGSDSHRSELTEHLRAKGARVFYGQQAAEPGSAFRADDEKLQIRCRDCRDSREDYHHIYGSGDPYGGRERSYHIGRRYPPFHWRQYPGGRF